MAPRRVPTDGLLPIGRFARATGLTVKALRHYAALGVLRPAHVDAGTGYRSYALAQLRTAAVIARLRALEVPLAEVAALVAADEATRRARLRAHRDRLAARLRETGRVLDALDRVLDGEEALVPETTLPELTVEHVPARTYVLRRDRVPMEELTQVIPRLIGETAGWVPEGGGPAGAPMARVGPPDDAGVVDLEVGWPVAAGAARLGPPAPLELVTSAPTRAVVHEHVGPYEALPRTYAVLEQALAAAQLRPTGPARESYETNPEEEPDPQQWVTRIVWPVA
jgi:DNA-binding transcriptional MerR regulator